MKVRFFAWVLISAFPWCACSTSSTRPEKAASKEVSAERLILRQNTPSAKTTSTVIDQIERKLKRSKSKQLLISKKLLRRLLEEEKASEAERARVSAQLQALKNVDREEAQLVQVVQ